MTSINSKGPINPVSVAPTASRVTPAPATPFKEVLNASASAVLEGAQAAAQVLPGGSVLAAAVRGGANAGSMSTAPGAATSATGDAGTAGDAGGIEGIMAKHSQDAMEMLKVQSDIQAETRQYTATSNIMKARHDAQKNAIGNIR